MSKGLNVIWCDNIGITEDFLEVFWWSNFFIFLNYAFFIKYFFIESNILKAHLSYLSFS